MSCWNSKFNQLVFFVLMDVDGGSFIPDVSSADTSTSTSSSSVAVVVVFSSALVSPTTTHSSTALGSSTTIMIGSSTALGSDEVDPDEIDFLTTNTASLKCNGVRGGTAVERELAAASAWLPAELTPQKTPARAVLQQLTMAAALKKR